MESTYLTVTILTQAGNVVTGEMVEQLILNGADIVKIGIGPGNKNITVPLRVYCLHHSKSPTQFLANSLFECFAKINEYFDSGVAEAPQKWGDTIEKGHGMPQMER